MKTRYQPISLSVQKEVVSNPLAACWLPWVLIASYLFVFFYNVNSLMFIGEEAWGFWHRRLSVDSGVCLNPMLTTSDKYYKSQANITSSSLFYEVWSDPILTKSPVNGTFHLIYLAGSLHTSIWRYICEWVLLVRSATVLAYLSPWNLEVIHFTLDCTLFLPGSFPEGNKHVSLFGPMRSYYILQPN